MFDVADVVGGDVEEGSHVEGQAVDAVDLVGLGGDLHHQVSHAVVRGLAHHAERVQRLRRGQLRRQHGMTVKAEVHRREQRATAMRIFVQDGMRQIGGGGLAFGAGDADDREFVLGHAVEGGGQQAHGLVHVLYDDADGFRAIGVFGFRHVCGQAFAVDAVKEFRLETALDEQHRTGLDLAGIVGDRPDRLIRAGQIRSVKRPSTAVNDFAKQMMLLQHVDCIGKRERCRFDRHFHGAP